MVAWNASVAQTNKKGREARISKAEDEFRLVLESVKKGEIKSRKENGADSALPSKELNYWMNWINMMGTRFLLLRNLTSMRKRYLSLTEREIR